MTGARGKTKGIWTDGSDADMMGNMENNERILELLERNYQGAQSALHFQNAYELLTATILAAQCTDVRVNMVTKDLFKKYPDALSLAEAHHWLIHHGREVCHARKPDCENCVLSGLCPWLAEKEKA